jgi:hypothetical protein
MQRIGLSTLVLLVAPALLRAQSGGPSTTPSDTAPTVTFGAFADGYYAYDFNRPATLDRAFTTQAARHNEFNVNLAYVDATLAGTKVRGRFAAQFGTSVQANYAPEPRVGTLSGPDVSRFIQEAYVGYRVVPTVWLDGGVFFSPFGSESWISRDNWTYTRSLIAENSPYYEAGVKATWQAAPPVSVQLHLINGWQNISETNSDKAVGLRLDYAVSPRLALAYDGFLGNEAPDSLPARTRLWQEGIVTVAATDRLQLRGTFDYGTQRRAGGGNVGNGVWRGYAVIARYQLQSRAAVALRAEGYSDPEQIIVSTGLPYGLRASGWSLNVDVAPQPRLLWRTEARLLSGRDPLFPSTRDAGRLAARDPVVVSSFAVTF